MIYLLANTKGGSTKSSLVSSLIHHFPGKKLAIDLDPQGTLSDYFRAPSEKSFIDYFFYGSELTIFPTSFENIDLLPSPRKSEDISGRKMTDSLKKKYHKVLSLDYDNIFIDTMGLKNHKELLLDLAIQGINQSTVVILPVNMEMQYIKGAKTIIDLINNNTKKVIVPNRIEKALLPFSQSSIYREFEERISLLGKISIAPYIHENKNFFRYIENSEKVEIKDFAKVAKFLQEVSCLE